MATVYLRDFPEDLHHKAKIQAAIARTTLKDLVVQALEGYLKNDDKRPVKIADPEVGSKIDRTQVYDAWSLSTAAISRLESILPDDPTRTDALLRVKVWVENELTRKAFKTMGKESV